MIRSFFAGAVSVFGLIMLSAGDPIAAVGYAVAAVILVATQIERNKRLDAERLS